MKRALNVLLLGAPASWVLHFTQPNSPWIFIAAALSLVPLAGLIGDATEQLADRSGPAMGGVLNATFGNAAELIIAVIAVNQHQFALVKASITGSIIGNLLLVLGLSFFAGGLGRRTQTFNRTAATNATALLFLAVVALVMPAVFDLSIYGSLAARPRAIDHLSLISSIIMIAAYVGSLIYAFSVRCDLFRSSHQREKHGHRMTPAMAIGLLAAATVLTTVQADLLVGTLTPAMEGLHLTEFFVGVIIVAIIGNAAEHWSAVSAARRDQMTLAIEISVGSSAQIALFVAPLIVLYSFAIGHPMSLLFNAFEIAAIALSVLATLIVVIDGESNWVEGLQLMAVYLILAVAFYLVPAGG